MSIHVANVTLMHVDSVTKAVFTKDGSKIKDFTTVKVDTVNMPRTYSTEHRLVPDASIPNTSGAPDIPTYLAAENAGGYKFVHMDQTYIITQT
jgi:hypothetical protein